MTVTQYDRGYLAGYLYEDPTPKSDPNWIQGWLQGGSDAIAGEVPPTQFIFDMTIQHLLDQGRSSSKSMGGGLSCQYRGCGGLKCAAGLWIREEDYKPIFEGAGITTDRLEPMFPPGFWRTHLDLLIRLQEIHDSLPRDVAWSEEDIARLKSMASATAEQAEIEWKFG